MRVKQKYKNTLNKYLEWVKDDFLRPKYKLDPDGMTAAEAMLRWETYGESLPVGCQEPELLAVYVQGKTCRDFYIKNWRDDCKESMAYPEEFLYTLGFDEVEFRSVFGRAPEPMSLFNLGMIEEFLRFTQGSTEPTINFLRDTLTKLKGNGS